MKTIKKTQRASFNALQDTVGQKQMVVFKAIKSNRGATLFELVSLLRWPVNSISGRVTELTKLGLIRDSGRTRLNPKSGKKGVVWKTGA